MKIIFLGTPAFAVPSLKILVENGYEIVAVITAEDKAAGRGQRIAISDVKKYALEAGLKILQPKRMNDPVFLDEVKSLQADLQIVVAFRMMPEALWSMPPLGTFNLHGSLLPQYRGAAPINRAIMNGETKTGLTTFFLKHEIDTGLIIYRKEVPIGPEDTAGDLHDRMMEEGALLVLKTVRAIENNAIQLQPQEEYIQQGEEVKSAPKIFKEDCKLDFSKDIHHLNNQVRGLSPFPGAFFDLALEDGSLLPVKVFRAIPEPAGTVLTHEIISDGKNTLKISAADGFLVVQELQLPGKKRMKTEELLRGFKFPERATIL